MPGLIIDIDWLPAPRLSVEGERVDGHLTNRHLPRPVRAEAPGSPESAPSMRSAVIAGRPNADEDTAALLGRARALGYVENWSPTRALGACG